MIWAPEVFGRRKNCTSCLALIHRWADFRRVRPRSKGAKLLARTRIARLTRKMSVGCWSGLESFRIVNGDDCCSEGHLKQKKGCIAVSRARRVKLRNPHLKPDDAVGAGTASAGGSSKGPQNSGVWLT
jgi:hypothetical protein